MLADIEMDMVADIDFEIQLFGQRLGYRAWLIGPKLFRPEAYLTCLSSKLYKFIFRCFHVLGTLVHSVSLYHNS